MKKLQFLFLTLLALTILSCQDDNISVNELSLDEQKSLVINEALESAVLDDLLQDIDSYSLLGEGLKSAQMGDCPIITIEKSDNTKTWPRIIILDYGDGCERNGKLKSGKMIITKDGPWYKSGTTRKVTFENFEVDGMSIDGEKEIENITADDGNATFAIKAELDLVWVKNDTLSIVVHRKIDKTQEWIFGFRHKDVKGQILLNGQTEVTRSVNGVSKEIKKKYNDISVVFGCRFPQSGVSEFEVKTFEGVDLNFSLDYGTEGTAGERCRKNCDCIATLNIESADSEDIDLSERWRKWTKEKKKKETDS